MNTADELVDSSWQPAQTLRRAHICASTRATPIQLSWSVFTKSSSLALFAFTSAGGLPSLADCSRLRADERTLEHHVREMRSLRHFLCNDNAMNLSAEAQKRTVSGWGRRWKL